MRQQLARGGIGLWGFVGTVVLTGLMAVGQALGLTRMSLPYMLGTMFTPDRDRAKMVGFGVHLVNGWLFALLYAAAFRSWRRATWWLGAAIGLVHALFVLLAALPLLPGLHPRMASEQRGPTPTRQLEPPGILALNYGRRTPLAVILAHLAYGALLGAFYRVSPVERERTWRPQRRRASLSQATHPASTHRRSWARTSVTGSGIRTAGGARWRS